MLGLTDHELLEELVKVAVRIEHQLHRLVRELRTMITKEDQMATNLDALAAQVAQTIGVEQSAITLIQGLATQISQLGTDPAAIAGFVSQLNSSASALAAAVAAGTAPPPPTG